MMMNDFISVSDREKHVFGAEVYTPTYFSMFMLFLSLPAQANDTIRDWLTSGTFSRRSSPPIYWQSHMFCRDTERRSLVLRPSCECSDCADYPTCAVVLVSSPAAESNRVLLSMCWWRVDPLVPGDPAWPALKQPAWRVFFLLCVPLRLSGFPLRRRVIRASCVQTKTRPDADEI